ncbi:MOSC domain-containing protein [Actinomycetospora termitidis]|uniref:MOSC domain-containing protein n=1 Tax=Actinomycetospora termitidis TaxID=3053470 RepID=A0ABT7MDY9_9PSEU|nr:MOSC domain-containing protein [Actinomycetospora sp. Odt1-22]MDL5158202.1 MOSC domain-containing protein [Actinomycetospora sp. Odt1-22]
MGVIVSVNVGVERPILAKTGRSGIDKRPVDGPVAVGVPGTGDSGLAGDTISDVEHHGGPDQAVYAYAREDLDAWGPTLGPLHDGVFGENLTTRGLDVTGARIGERWRIGDGVVLQVTVPRIPCRTFAAWLDRNGWVKEFTAAAVPGAYLRVVEPGEVRAGDPVAVERPDHDVTVGLAFRAVMTTPELLPDLVPALDALPDDVAERVLRRVR